MTRGFTLHQNGEKNVAIVHTDIGDQTYDLSVMSASERGEVFRLLKDWWAEQHGFTQKVAA